MTLRGTWFTLGRSFYPVDLFGLDGHAVDRSWTLGTSQSTYVSMVEAIKNAVGKLNDLGLTSSYQNEGSAWETNWQQGKDRVLLARVDFIGV